MASQFSVQNIFGSAEQISPLVFAVRAVIIGILLYLEGKVLPHRSAGQFAGPDFALFWMIGGLTAAPLFQPQVGIISTLPIVIIILGLHYIISYAAVKNRKFASMVFGKPVILMSGGQINGRNLARSLFPLKLLMSDMRTVDAPNMNEVESAVLETCGHVSVLKKGDYQSVTPKDLGIPVTGSGLPVTLVKEGKVIHRNLKELGYDERWLHQELLKKGISDLHQVYTVLVDPAGKLFISVNTKE